MKKINFLFALLTLISFAGFSQQKNSELNGFNKRDFGIYLGVNTFENAYDMPVLNNGKSIYAAIQFRKNHRLTDGIAIGTGIETSWNNYAMQYEEAYFVSQGQTDFDLTDYPLEKSKLVVHNLTLPLVLQLKAPDSKFMVGVGVYGSMRIKAFQKETEPDGQVFINKDGYNINQFTYGVSAEAGTKGFRLFVKYDLKPLFQNNNRINAQPLSFGIRL